VIDVIWNDVLINPMLNGLIILSRLLFNNFGLAIVVFTILVRLATLPLTLRQLHASRRMQTLAPKQQELQKKYKDPKRRQEELMKLYKEEGVNPVGCLGPMIIQMPIWFALYACLTQTVGGTPERIVDLSQRLYPWDFIQQAVPLPTQFMWLDLGRPDMALVVLVALTTWLQTKLSLSNTTTMSSSPQMQQTNQMMLWMMPLMFGWFTLSVPSGLAVYWTVTNIIGVVMNYFVYGWKDRPWMDMFVSANPQPGSGARPGSGPRKPLASGGATALTEPKSKRNSTAPDAGAGERQNDAQSGNKRKERRRSGGEGAPAARTRPVSGRRRGR
jgi:YidC/Oxa1 family membrane protein insertase